MQSNEEIAFKRLKNLLEESGSATYEWTRNGKSTEWRQNVQSALRRMLGKDCEHLEAFNNVRYGPLMVTSSTSDSAFHNSYMSGMVTAMGIIRSALQEYEDYELRAVDSGKSASTSGAPTAIRKVFVVHGHDNEMKESVARFLERLGFEPIILDEQASAGGTILEKFEQNTEVDYAVVLLSPDDVGAAKTKPDELQPRARQNVVLELGYFLGRLGRSRVCPLVRGKLEIPSDFHGVVYVAFEGQDWKLHLVKELKHLGYEIDANKAF